MTDRPAVGYQLYKGLGTWAYSWEPVEKCGEEYAECIPMNHSLGQTPCSENFVSSPRVALTFLSTIPPLHHSSAERFPFSSNRLASGIAMAWWENRGVLRVACLTSALATTAETWMSADVPTWPETLPWLPATGNVQKHHSTALRF